MHGYVRKRDTGVMVSFSGDVTATATEGFDDGGAAVAGGWLRRVYGAHDGVGVE
ncbi:hypothetical protein SESBI_33045 [Sesbania bispinosa]|nr:hypothetical protein SESBI_33045 [Sesbania bispinosa]